MASPYSHGERPTTALLLQKMKPNVWYTVRALCQLTGRGADAIHSALYELRRRGVVGRIGTLNSAARWVLKGEKK